MTNATAVEQDLDHVRARLYELRWLAGDGAATYTDITVSGTARAALAHLVGTDMPALIAALEQMIARAQRAEQERDALLASIAERAPFGGAR